MENLLTTVTAQVAETSAVKSAIGFKDFGSQDNLASTQYIQEVYHRMQVLVVYDIISKF